MAKLVKKQKRPQITGADTIVTFMEYFVTILCVTIMILVPLYMKNAYYEIGQCKYDMYYGITLVGLPVLLIFTVIYLFFKRKTLSIKKMWKSLSYVDIAVGSYLICALMSFFLCNYKEEAWSGYPGWNMGLYAQITFALLYFFVSRYGRDYKAILTILLGVSVIVILLGVLNRFLIDPLGVYEGIPEYYCIQFLSTLGQSSWYSSFLCIVLPIGIYAFWKSEKINSQVVMGGYVLLCFMSLVTQNSDSAYVAFMAAMLVFLWFSFDDWKGAKKVFAIVFLFGVSGKAVQVILAFADGSVIAQLDRLSLGLIKGSVSWILIGAGVFFFIIFSYLEKRRAYPTKIMRVIRAVLFSGLGVGMIIAVVLLFISAHTEGNVPWSSIPYLVWNAHWGNSRGFTWEVSWKMFCEMSFINKLFGVGPESYPYYAYENYKSIVDAMWGGSVLTNAHNEWFNAVINYGLIGGVAYLGIFVSGVASCVKKAKQMPEMVMVMACVVSYICHNFFCYQQVLCTPFIMIIIGIGQYIIKETK